MMGNDTPNPDDGGDRYLVTADSPVPMRLDVVAKSVKPIVITTDDGRLLLAFNGDGTIDVPDPERIEEAAGIFWREVTKFAQLCGFRVNWVQEGDPR